MVHSSKSLKERHGSDDDGFEVWTPSGRYPSFEPSSIDLHLSKTTGKVKRSDTVKVWDEETYPTVGMSNETNPVIEPQEFRLAETVENITIPADSVGFLHGRSSVGRLGLFIHNAGLVDAGFEGSLTLELFNPAPYPIQLKTGMRICQLTVHPHDEKPDVAYNDSDNKYQNQLGPTPSKLHEDFHD